MGLVARRSTNAAKGGSREADPPHTPMGDPLRLIHPTTALLSFPRKRESMLMSHPEPLWIPAFAGMINR